MRAEFVTDHRGKIYVELEGSDGQLFQQTFYDGYDIIEDNEDIFTIRFVDEPIWIDIDFLTREVRVEDMSESQILFRATSDSLLFLRNLREQLREGPAPENTMESTVVSNGNNNTGNQNNNNNNNRHNNNYANTISVYAGRGGKTRSKTKRKAIRRTQRRPGKKLKRF